MKRTIALVLTLALLLTAIAGCVKKSPGAKAEPEDTSEYEALYAPVLKKYKQAFDEGWSREKFVENNLSPNLANLDKSAEPSFAFVDLDNDKTPELFIGRADEPATAYDLYRADSEGIRQLTDATSEAPMTVTEDGRLVETGDDYAHLEVTVFYEVRDGEVVPVKAVIHDPDRIIDGMNDCFETDAALPADEREIYADMLQVISQADYDREAKDYKQAETQMKTFDDLDEATLEDSGKEIIPAKASMYLTATAADFDVLGTDFHNYDSILNTLASTLFMPDEETGVEKQTAAFNSADMDSADLKGALFYITYSKLYQLFFEEPEEAMFDASNDPFPELEESTYYLKYSEKNILWLAENVLNMEQPFDRNAFCDGVAGFSTPCGYKDGDFYFPSYGYSLDWGELSRIKSAEMMDDHRYRLTIEYFHDAYGETYAVNGEGTMIAGLKDIDGQRVWSIYSYSADITVDFSQIADMPPQTFQYPDAAQTESTSPTAEDTALTGNTGDYITFGRYEQDNDTSNGPEPIEWLVLDRDGDKALVISRYGLDCQKYYPEKYDVTWETCTLRTWLNNDFYNNAFSTAEQSKIQMTTVKNDDNPDHGTEGGNNTQDKVFLLSIGEVSMYFSSDETRKCAPTAYAIEHGAWASDSNTTIGGTAACWWWLRSPGSLPYGAANVIDYGSVNSRGYSVAFSNYAVRPAMWITLDA
ncbi:MAG: hypothetical protein IJL52_01270 [Clostridia bacterium]|nr:hypothetical protein [Clostridia bacterium]